MGSNDNERGGFSKPPKSTQFKKGQSGNPNGRPKGRSTLVEAIEKAEREPVVLNENGRRRKISKREAVIIQLVNKGASGDLRAIKQLVVRDRSLKENRKQDPQVPDRFSEQNAPDMDRLMRNILANAAPEPSGEGSDHGTQ